MKKTGNVLLHLRLPPGLAPVFGQSAARSTRGLIRMSKDVPVMFEPAVNLIGGGVRGGNPPQFSGRESAGMKSSIGKSARKKKAEKGVHSRGSKKQKGRSILAKTGFRATRGTTVGIWDLGTWSGRLPSLLSSMNNIQAEYQFFTVEATVPVGIIRRKEAVIEWVERNCGSRLSSNQRKEVGDNIVAHDFFSVAKGVRKEIGIDYLVGITPSKVAFSEGGEVFWDYFSTFEGRCILASAYDLRNYALKGKRPFEVFLAVVILGQMLLAQFWGRGLEFHEEQHYCLFDFNEDRDSLIDSVRNLHIDEECLKKVGPKSRDAAVALTKLVRRFR